MMRNGAQTVPISIKNGCGNIQENKKGTNKMHDEKGSRPTERGFYGANETAKIIGRQRILDFAGRDGVAAPDIGALIDAYHATGGSVGDMRIAFDFFSLGVIYGKKIERARRHGGKVKPIAAARNANKWGGQRVQRRRQQVRRRYMDAKNTHLRHQDGPIAGKYRAAALASCNLRGLFCYRPFCTVNIQKRKKSVCYRYFDRRQGQTLPQNRQQGAQRTA